MWQRKWEEKNVKLIFKKCVNSNFLRTICDLYNQDFL